MRKLFFSIKETDTYIKYKFLLGIISIKKDMFYLNETVRLFGVPIYRKKLSKNTFFNSIIEKYPQYDEYYIFTSRSGEFYLLMHHLQEWIRQNNSKNYLLIFKAKYHVDIFKMFFPTFENYVHFTDNNSADVNSVINSVESVYNGKRFFVPTYNEYFNDVEFRIRNNGEHYYKILKSHLGLSDNIEKLKNCLPEKSKLEIENYAKYILHNKFVFISPETLSNELISPKFWQNLVDKFIEHGYEVFCNAMNVHNIPKGCKSAFFTFPESIELVKYATAVVGLRSGFIETVTSYSNKQYHILYTDFPPRGKLFPRLSSDKVKSGFSIKTLPMASGDCVFEYDVNQYHSLDFLSEEIFNKIVNV